MLHVFKIAENPYFLGLFRFQADRSLSAGIRGKPLKSGKTVHFWQLVWQLFKPS
jgi:hypothetical protein